MRPENHLSLCVHDVSFYAAARGEFQQALHPALTQTRNCPGTCSQIVSQVEEVFLKICLNTQESVGNGSGGGGGVV